MLLKIPRRALAGWSLSDRLLEVGAGEKYELRVLSPAAQGWEATFHLRGNSPVPVEVHEIMMSGTPEMLHAKLPPWATSRSRVIRVTTLRL